MKKISNLFKLFIIILLLLFSAFFFFTSTEAGIYASLNLLTKIWPEFNFQKIQGSLTQGLFIEKLDFNGKNYTIHTENLQMHLNFPLTLEIDGWEFKKLTLHHPMIEQEISAKIKASISPKKFYLQIANDKTVLNLQGKTAQKGLIITTFSDNSLIESSLIDLSHNLSIKASIQQQPFFNWQASITGKQFAPSTFLPSLPGKINFTLVGLGDSKGSVIQLQKLTGQLRQKKITGTMHIARNRLNFNLNSKLKWGDAHLFLQGGATEQWKLNWQLSFPNITDLLINSSGKMDSQGYIYGQRNSPHLKILVNASHLNFSDSGIERLRANIDLDLAENGIFQIAINAENLHYDQYYFDSFILKGDGNTNAHTLEAQVQEENQKLTLALKGAYLDRIWQEKLLKMDLLSPLAGNWRLKNPALILFSPEMLHINPITWQSQSANINTELDWQRHHHYTTKLLIQHLPIAQVRALLPDQNLLHNPRGHIEADIKIINTEKIKKTSKKSKETIIQDFSLTGFFKLQNIAFDIPAYGLIFKDISFTAQANNRALNYRGSIESTEGLLHINGKTELNASNYVSNLKIQGDNFLIYNKPALSLYISPDLTANLKKNQLDIEGKITIPKATLKSVKSSGIEVKLHPDVVFVDDLGNQSAPGKPSEKKSSLKISSKIQIILSDNFNFDLEGFTGKLTGHLDTQDDPPHPTRVNGKLQIVDGNYTIYGQNLTVTQGWLGFINSPIDNPIIHIQAVKKINPGDSTEAESLQSQTTVGLSVDGNLKKPQTILFSDPPGKSQKDILSLLMFERTTDEITNGDNNLGVLIKAASSLNFGGHNNNLNQLITQLQHGLGLNELGVKSETTFNEFSSNSASQNTSFVLGKFISSRLYLKYSIGLLDSINTFTIRYLLGKKFTAQGQTNEQGSGVDLIYTIQKE